LWGFIRQSYNGVTPSAIPLDGRTISEIIAMSISKPAARKSATVLAPLSPAPVTVLPFAPETAPKATGKKGGKVPEIHVEQHFVDAFLSADGNVKAAAVDLFRACVVHSVTPAQFGARSDNAVRASEFNNAHKVAQLLGRAVTLQIIDAAAAHGMDRRANVLHALRKAKDMGKAIRSAQLKGEALKKALAKAGRDTLTAAKDAQTFAKKSAPKGAQHRIAIPAADSLEAYVPVAMAALGDMLEKLGKLDIPTKMLRKVEDLRGALTEGADILGTMVKPAE
jgi:hypothetical protein